MRLSSFTTYFVVPAPAVEMMVRKINVISTPDRRDGDINASGETFEQRLGTFYVKHASVEILRVVAKSMQGVKDILFSVFAGPTPLRMQSGAVKKMDHSD